MDMKEVIERLNGKWKVPTLGKEIGIPEKKFRSALHLAGYAYDNSGKSWRFVGEGEEPSGTTIQHFVSHVSSHKGEGHSTRERNEGEGNADNDSHSYDSDSPSRSHKGETKFTQSKPLPPSDLFTPEQYTALIEIATERIGQTAFQSKREQLHKRITKLNPEAKTRKTVLMSESVGERFDRFAAKMKFNKSDLLELALIELMDAFEEEE